LYIFPLSFGFSKSFSVPDHTFERNHAGLS
jgi:hypothetical protein